MKDLLSRIPSDVNKRFVETMYHSLVDFRDNKKEKTVTDNGGPKTGRDFMNTDLCETSETNGFTWTVERASFHQYVVFHHTDTNIIYLFISEDSLNALREQLLESKQGKIHYLEAWAFTNDRWSNTSLREQPGQVVASFDSDDNFLGEKYDDLRSLNRKLLVRFKADLCVLVTHKIKQYKLMNVTAVVPSSNLADEYLHIEDWGHHIPVLYDGETVDEPVIESDDFELQLQDGILEEKVDLGIEIEQNDADTEEGS